MLAERYEVDAQESLEDCLLNVAVTFVNDNYQDYLAELMEAKAGSLLEKLDEDNTRLQMLTALSYSVGYMLHIRSGLPGEHISEILWTRSAILIRQRLSLFWAQQSVICLRFCSAKSQF